MVAPRRVGYTSPLQAVACKALCAERKDDEYRNGSPSTTVDKGRVVEGE
jgi:hypothetical protein